MNVKKAFQYIREHGLRGFFSKLQQKLWPLHKSHVYWWDESFEVKKKPDLDIRRYPALQDVDESVFETLEAEGAAGARGQFADLFRSGNELWLAYLDGRLAGVSWSSTGRDREDYYVSLGRQDATILGCLTFESFRGRGIYPAMLKHIVDYFLAQGKRRIYGDVKQWNQSSIRGIEKTGIRYLGTAWRLKLGRRTWVFGRSWQRRSSPYGKRGLALRLVYLATALGWWVLTGFGLFGRRGTVILCYHNVERRQARTFRRQMRAIRRRAVSPDRLPGDGIRLGKPLNVCVTFDDAYASLRDHALPALKEYAVPSVIFVPTANLDRTPQWEIPRGFPEGGERICGEAELQDIAADGLVTIGSHTHTHPDLTAIATEAVREELQQSKERLEQLLGARVRDLSYPHGAYTPGINRTAQETGYTRIYVLNSEIVHAQDGVLGRFRMFPDVWHVEFLLTAAGAYAWLYWLRKWVHSFTLKPEGVLVEGH